jgi:uncharacterized membrane protein YbaN (DUF454 family)
MWQWLTVIGLAATPALILGQTAAWGAAFGFHLPTWPVGVAIALAGFAEGLLLLYLAALAERIPRLHRWLSKLRVPRYDAVLRRWGSWTAMLVGTAIAGQEPVIIALVWLGVPPKKLILPLFVENVVFTVVYYFVMKIGWAAITGLVGC